MAKQQEPKQLEITTRRRVDPPITVRELASAFLAPSELKSCIKESSQLVIKGSKLPAIGENTIRNILSVVALKYLQSGDVKVASKTTFRWTQAQPKICKKFGLVTLAYDGSRNKVTAIVISSIITADPEEHRRKLVKLMRRFRQRFHHHHLPQEQCLVTVECPLEEVKALEVSA